MPKMSETQIQSLGGEDPLEEEMGNPFQYSCLENPMDRGAWRSIVHGVTKSRIWLKRLSMHIHYFKKSGSISFWCGAATKIAYATKNIFYDPSDLPTSEFLLQAWTVHSTLHHSRLWLQKALVTEVCVSDGKLGHECRVPYPSTRSLATCGR